MRALSEDSLAYQSGQGERIYRAIGRYVVAFSYLIAEMRTGVEYRLQGDDPMIPRLALGEAFASQITNAFFAICEREADLDDEERQVAIRLKKEVNDAIKDRNDIAHGDWHINLWGRPEPHMVRIKPGRKAGAEIEKAHPVEELEDLANALEELAETLIEFAYLCFRIHPMAERMGRQIRIRDIYRFRKHRVLREGRFADEPWWDLDEPTD